MIIFFMNRIFSRVFSFFESKSGIQKKHLINQENSLDLLINSRKSLIRWGDGESTILGGGHLYFQRNSFPLMCNFIKIVRNYSLNSDFFIAMPNEFLIREKSELERNNKYRVWRFTRYVFFVFFKKKVDYLDSFIFREDTSLSNSNIKELWKNEDVIIFIHSNYKYYIDFKKENSSKIVKYISVTNANSYSKLNSIEDKVANMFDTYRFNKNKTTVLVSAGPAAKVISYALCKKGIRTLDMGHYFDYKFYNIVRNGK